MAAAADAFDNVGNFNYALQLFAHDTFCDDSITETLKLIPADLEKPKNISALHENLKKYKGNSSYEKLMHAVVKIGAIHAQIFIGTFLKRYHISATHIDKLKSFYLNYITKNPDHSLENFIKEIFSINTLEALDIAAGLDVNTIIGGYLKIIAEVFDQTLVALEKNDQKRLTTVVSDINREADIVGFSNSTVQGFLDTLTSELEFNPAKINRSMLVEYERSKCAKLTLRRRVVVSTFAAKVAKDVTDQPSKIPQIPTTDTIDLSGSRETPEATNLTDTTPPALAQSVASPVAGATVNPLSASSTTLTSPVASGDSTPMPAASSEVVTLKTAPIVNAKTGNCCFGFFRSNKIAPQATSSIKYNS